jgi:hypothetical protein
MEHRAHRIRRELLAAISAKLNEIEREMRRIGFRTDNPPDLLADVKGGKTTGYFSRRGKSSLSPFSDQEIASHSALVIPACRKMRASNSRPMSPRCGLGTARVISPLTMKACLPPV